MKLLLGLLIAFSTHAAGPVHLIELQGSINPGSAAYITESLQAAQQQQAQALILKLDTPGGLLSSTRDIIQGFSAATIPVVVFVAPGGASATSAGALITISSHVAAMAPGTNIGAAHPVGGGGEDVKGDMGVKVTNDTAALARSQAALRGRKAEAAETFVTKSASFAPDEAVKAGVVDFVATDLEDLLRKLDGRKVALQGETRTLATKGLSAASLVQGEMTMRQSLLHFFADPSISAILMTVGGIALYAEVSAGFTLIAPGVIGAFCFLLAFISLRMLPINTGGALLFGLGFLLLIAEIFVTSYGLLMISGVAAIFLGGLFLMDPASTSMQVPLPLLVSLVLALGGIGGFIGFLVLRERKRLAGFQPMDRLQNAVAEIVTVEGLSGSAYVNGELWQYESSESFMPGEKALVTAVSGLKVTLKRRT